MTTRVWVTRVWVEGGGWVRRGLSFLRREQGAGPRLLPSSHKTVNFFRLYFYVVCLYPPACQSPQWVMERRELSIGKVRIK